MTFSLSAMSISVELSFDESPGVLILIRIELLMSILHHTSHSPEECCLEMDIDAYHFY